FSVEKKVIKFYPDLFQPLIIFCARGLFFFDLALREGENRGENKREKQGDGLEGVFHNKLHILSSWFILAFFCPTVMPFRFSYLL
ncbi:hypothetical protein IKZ70_01015, partial [bacterium]|nr:hypothetical protein [bacterium]